MNTHSTIAGDLDSDHQFILSMRKRTSSKVPVWNYGEDPDVTISPERPQLIKLPPIPRILPPIPTINLKPTSPEPPGESESNLVGTGPHADQVINDTVPWSTTRFKFEPVLTNNTEYKMLEVLNENYKPIYRVMLFFNPAMIHILDDEDGMFMTIQQKLLCLHPEFTIKLLGSKCSKCTQRYKLNYKKFNYTKNEGGTLKMIGDFGSHFEIYDQSKITAKLWDMHDCYKLDIEKCSNSELPHMIALCSIMLLQKEIGTLGGKQVIISNHAKQMLKIK
ncbi:hypothetical protein AKO1_010180 [Acrasis kona]|uniref:Uncharacterized protein n=1 Tax=Acrasis kona TaxID=1008807 RepID=A0AAW2ZPB5_9EUKA